MPHWLTHSTRIQASAVFWKTWEIKLGHMPHAVQHSIGVKIKIPKQVGWCPKKKRVLINPHLMEFLSVTGRCHFGHAEGFEEASSCHCNCPSREIPQLWWLRWVERCDAAMGIQNEFHHIHQWEEDQIQRCEKTSGLSSSSSENSASSSNMEFFLVADWPSSPTVEPG